MLVLCMCVGMGLHFYAVLCGLCVSSVVGVAGGCESSQSLFCGAVMGWDSLSLCRVLLLILKFKNYF